MYNYEKKYIKYKLKYNNLKKIRGGTITHTSHDKLYELLETINELQHKDVTNKLTNQINKARKELFEILHTPRKNTVYLKE